QTRTGTNPVNTARQSINRQTVQTSTALKINTVKPMMNGVRHITAKVAGKLVSITEASIRTDLLFNDADGIDTLPNQAIFDAIQLMGYEGDLTKEGTSSERLSEAQPTPSPEPTSEAPNESLHDSSSAQSSEKRISKEQRQQRKRLSKKKKVQIESVSKQGRKNAKGDGKAKENAQSEGRTKEMMDEDKETDEVSTAKEGVNTDFEKVSTDRPKLSTDDFKVSTDD
ncbi:hypothetical protein Tco_1558795, partial [Tanacetum coccineum]